MKYVEIDNRLKKVEAQLDFLFKREKARAIRDAIIRSHHNQSFSSTRNMVDVIFETMGINLP